MRREFAKEAKSVGKSIPEKRGFKCKKKESFGGKKMPKCMPKG